VAAVARLRKRCNGRFSTSSTARCRTRTDGSLTSIRKSRASAVRSPAVSQQLLSMHVNDLLTIAVESGASDLHIKVGSFPMMRVRGVLVPASEEKKLDHEDVVAMSAAVMSTSQRQKFKEAQ